MITNIKISQFTNFKQNRLHLIHILQYYEENSVGAKLLLRFLFAFKRNNKIFKFEQGKKKIKFNKVCFSYL